MTEFTRTYELENEVVNKVKEDLKNCVTNMLWEYLPGDTTLTRAEDIKQEIISMILGEAKE